jgi:hypothetical protein
MNGEGRTPEASSQPSTEPDPSLPDSLDFRWQALFQRAREAVFVLNRRRKFLFVNKAWVELTGMPAAEARGLVCVRRGPVPQDPWDVVVRALCCPPREVLAGNVGRNRRLVPRTAGAARWWDLEFFPLHDERGLLCIVGKIVVESQIAPPSAPPLPEKLISLREIGRRNYGLDQLAGSAPGFQRIVEQVRLAAQTRIPVLIVGAPGTGKEWVARTIHHLSSAPAAAFACVDCNCLPAAVLSSLLNGDERLHPILAKGTRYLKEPACLPRDLQIRLCDSLAGGDGPEGLRTIAGISSDPAEEIRAGRLLEGLHCALSTLVIALPPLRERPADLPALVERFLERAGEACEHEVKGLTAEAWELVRGYHWPGNLSELYTSLLSACQETKHDHIDAVHLPARLRLAVRLAETPGPAEERKLPLDQLLEEAERRLIRLALRRAKGNRSRAAELLQVWRPRLLRRMEALGIKEW